MTIYRYGREKWVTELIDTVQFYVSKISLLASGVENLLAKAFQQKCCGFNSTKNYFMSFWQITFSGGTLYNVPKSCCVQRQEAFPPNNIAPVDDWCQFYDYNSSGQLSSVYTQVSINISNVMSK